MPHDSIIRLFADTLHVDVPSVETDLFEAGILDSLAFVELLMALEREFGVVTALDDLEVENFKTIERIAQFVAAHRTARSSHCQVVPINSKR